MSAPCQECVFEAGDVPFELDIVETFSNSFDFRNSLRCSTLLRGYGGIGAESHSLLHPLVVVIGNGISFALDVAASPDSAVIVHTNRAFPPPSICESFSRTASPVCYDGDQVQDEQEGFEQEAKNSHRVCTV